MYIKFPHLGLLFPYDFFANKMNWIREIFFGIQRVALYILAYFDDIMEMTSSILRNQSNILVFSILTYIAPMKLIISEFSSFRIISILWATEHSWLLCRLMKSLLLYSDVNIFFTFRIIFPGSFFCARSSKKLVISSIHNQWISNDCWISSALMFVVLFLLGVMLCSGERRITGQVVMDRSYPWCYDYNGTFASALVSFSCWNFYCGSCN